MQDDSLVTKVNAGLGVGCERRFEGFGETWLELSHCLEAGAELRMEPGPRNASGLGQSMQSPSKPHVDIERHGAVT